MSPPAVSKTDFQSVSDSGEVGDYEFVEATIRSRAKLSYYAVDRYLNGQFDELMSGKVSV